MKKYRISITTAVLGMCLASQAGLIAHYNFDDSANMTTDDSGNGHTLTVFSGYGTPTYDAAGKYGGGSSFNGTDQGWFISDNIYSMTGSFSFSAWVKTAGTTSMITQPWGTSDGFDLYVAAGSYRFMTRYDSTYSYTIGSAGPVDSVWQHVSMTYEASSGPVAGVYTGTIKGYLDGELIATKTDAQYEGTTFNDMAIGRRSTAVFNGVMDEIYMHDNALTQTDIQALMVPEPATMGLVGIVGIGMFLVRRISG